MTDIEIARSVTPKPIGEIAEKLGINPNEIEPYGRTKAKLPLHLLKAAEQKKAKLILVTAISPTPAGEGKTTTTVGLTDGLAKIGKKSVAALREPSLGPVFGIKGGAAGGGWAQVIPMEDINLHFTGDFSAVEKANNLLAALVDNNIQSKKRNLGIDPRTVLWKRVMDMNDRAIRQTIVGMGGKSGGIMRESGFNITAASEIMAILCMSQGLQDLKERFDRIYIGDTYAGEPVFAKDLNASEAMAILMKDAINPNLVQTLEGNPAILHGGPFANIAQGTNSINATKMAMRYGDWVVTEAGFGADLGAEKFINLKCRTAELNPSAVVIVATVRALKYHGGKALDELNTPDTDALAKGIPNLEKHIESIQSFGIPVVVAINTFLHDSAEEHELIRQRCAALGVKAELSQGWGKGGDGMTDLAQSVVSAAENFDAAPKFTYELTDSLEDKVNKIAKTMYGADGVVLSAKAKTQLKRFEKIGLADLPVCMAKTQKSLTDNEKVIGRPTGFKITVREFEIAAGAGFIIPITGAMLRMPGLPEVPAAENMSIDAHGIISGLS
ncbi:MAG: formate--tetrahydrofolate ligase [Bacteroidetes bacterium]|nr:formate--tetrahydrofolate ligase [Bacteroidota bacterium]MDA0942628.1 formate--tetrahydrofolate ligase [Bacteroidota bacterium]MDA1111936.1 formate--tetrahydrofolate ligase [Bacteroidota bacterium]